MQKVRVLIVEDSATIRGRLREILEADPEIDLVGVAVDGKQGIELCEKLRPDVMTMDMMLPIMSGLAATEYIMAHFPTPILIVSSSVNRGEVFKTYEALAAGAVDVLEKPFGDEPAGSWEARFLSTVKLVSRIRVITHPRARLGAFARRVPPAPSVPGMREPLQNLEVAAIGASTGGPGAIIEVLRALPPRFDVPILVVLHINALFAPAFAEWLDGQTSRRAAYARDGELVASHAGRVVIAPPDRHLIVSGGRLRVTSDPERHSCRPSVDVLFESLAREYGPSAAAALLTGMGRDGASGLLDIRRAGGFTIAQDEATSVVYGMPREAAQIGAAVQVLPLSEIGPALASTSVERAEAVA
jgi:two-component system, chemotaxis family, protein-glutamate methylesterase/glutaminase